MMGEPLEARTVRLCSLERRAPTGAEHAVGGGDGGGGCGGGNGGGGGDDSNGDSGFVLTTMDGLERAAALALWEWQLSMSAGRHDEKALVSVMKAWHEDIHEAGRLSLLRGRAMAVKAAGDLYAIVLVRYDLDVAESPQLMLCGKHAMVVEATAFNPAIPPWGLERTGDVVRGELVALAASHGQRLLFEPLMGGESTR